jgi:hypothetical protein
MSILAGAKMESVIVKAYQGEYLKTIMGEDSGA